MTVHPGQHISPDPPHDVAQNFSDLLQVGIAAAQRLSQDHWTDFNEHDPGVTILEALTYALTDLSYRIDHPMEDILASSMAETGTRLTDQPLFTGDRILTCAPHTALDFRKTAYDSVRGLRDMWILPAPGDMTGVHRVLVHPYPEAVGVLDEPSLDQILSEVADILNANRPMGEDFLWPEIAPVRELCLSAEITISSEATPETVLADILFRIDQQINPAPQLREVGRDLQAGISADVIFDGPRLDLGWIPDGTLPPFGRVPRNDTIADIILATDWVTDLGAFALKEAGRTGNSPDGKFLSVIARRADAMNHITILRDGIQQNVDNNRVLAFLSHKEESARWAAGYASYRTDDLAYAQVPLGNPRRNLSRYRSLQHLFPPNYRLGHEDARVQLLRSDPSDRSEITESGQAAPSQDNPQALRMQLKAYLLFFEQILANALMQLSHTAEQFSFEAGRTQTYHTQPLRPERRDSADSPPDIAVLLGADLDVDQDTQWWVSYCDRLQILSKQADPVQQRLNSMRDGLLARFGAVLPDQRLQQLWDRDHQDPGWFQTFLAEQKRQRLSQIATTDARRGIGHDPLNFSGPSAPESSALEVIRNLTGHSGPIKVLDHVLLRPPGLLDGIGRLTIDKDFAITASAPYWAARLSHGGVSVHVVADTDTPYGAWFSLVEQIIKCGLDPAHLQLSSNGGYMTHLRLDNGKDARFHVLEGFGLRSEARKVGQWIVDLCNDLHAQVVDIADTLRPVELPLMFYDRQLSIILAPGCDTPDGPEYQAFVDGIMRERLPAHLRHICYWVNRQRDKQIETDVTEWQRTMAACRTARRPNADCLRDLDTAGTNLRGHIQALFVDRLRAHKSNWFRRVAS